MKKLLSLMLILVFAVTLSACDIAEDTPRDIKNNSSFSKGDNQPSAPAVTRDRAIEIALIEAGLTLEQVHDLDADLDRERGIAVWEIDFEHQNIEYSYDINAETEEIIKGENEYD